METGLRTEWTPPESAILILMEIYLVDGTYELFRHFFAVPSARDHKGREVGAREVEEALWRIAHGIFS